MSGASVTPIWPRGVTCRSGVGSRSSGRFWRFLGSAAREDAARVAARRGVPLVRGSPGCRRDLEIAARSCAHDRALHRAAGRCFAHQPHEVLHAAHALAIELHHDVAVHQARSRCRTVCRAPLAPAHRPAVRAWPWRSRRYSARAPTRRSRFRPAIIIRDMHGSRCPRSCASSAGIAAPAITATAISCRAAYNFISHYRFLLRPVRMAS